MRQRFAVRQQAQEQVDGGPAGAGRGWLARPKRDFSRSLRSAAAFFPPYLNTQRQSHTLCRKASRCAVHAVDEGYGHQIRQPARHQSQVGWPVAGPAMNTRRERGTSNAYITGSSM